MVKRYNFSYVGVPELHKSGRVHFHFLMSGDLRLINSGTVLIPERSNPVRVSYAVKLHPVRSDWRIVYNLDNWKFGFSTAINFVKCDDNINGNSAIAKYLVKYMTKDNCRLSRNYYYAGGHIDRDVKTEYFNVDFNAVDAPVYSVADTLQVKYVTVGGGLL